MGAGFRWLRTLLGINVLWVGLSMLFDGLNTLLLPHSIEGTVEGGEATTFGVLSFLGIATGMLVQPVAGHLSDQLYPRWGRIAPLGVMVALTALSLGAFAAAGTAVLVVGGYLLVQLVGNAAQAIHQALLPDLVPERLRGRASGLRGFMDLVGAMIGFALLGSLLEDGGVGPAVFAVVASLTGGYLIVALLLRDRPEGAPPPPSMRWREVFLLDPRDDVDFVRVVVARFLFLLGTFAVGRFFLFFVAARLGLRASEAASEAGFLLAGLALVTALSAPPAGWLADRLGRRRVMMAAAVLSAIGAFLLVVAHSPAQILLFGSLMSVGSGAFVAASWALVSDLAPRNEAARFMGLANLGTAAAAAAAGLLGPLVDLGNEARSGRGYTVLLAAAALAFLASVLPMRGLPAGRVRGPEAALADAEPVGSRRGGSRLGREEAT